MDVPQFIAGRFRVECEIAKGGMGTVYRATHLGLQRSVAVKIIKPEYAEDTDVADRFLREARTMARLRHPRAAMIFDAGNLPDGRYFIIMEFIEGTTLSEALAREGRFAPERAVKIAIQICEVLEEAHQLGIIHRDLKPSNIMLNERGVCVLDFGVAKVLASTADATASHASTGSGQIIGTPRYMSPEQCLGQRVGASSDLYSLGVVLYEMLAGRPPFIDHLPSAVLVKQATTAPPPLPTLCPGLPRSLALAVHTLLAKRSEDRPQTAAVTRALLEEILSQPEPGQQELAEVAPEVEPFASILAAANYSRAAIFRVAAPLVLVSIMGALLLVLGYGGSAAELATRNELSAEVPGGAATDTGEANKTDPKTAKSPIKPAETVLSLDRARRIASSFSHGTPGDLAVIQTAAGPAVVAIHDENKVGKTHFFVIERRGARYRITDRGPLDAEDFRAKKWNAERVDAGGDGRNQVLFTGISGNQHALLLVLYDPGTRQSYTLRVQTDRRTDQTRLMQWSENTADSSLAAYRILLRDKARALLGTAMRG